jgi:hypothetical protein
MKRISGFALVFLLGLVFLGLVNGCGSTPQYLAGTWQFTFTPGSSSAQSIQATAVLTQLGNSIFGPVTLAGNDISCGTQAMMSGNVNGYNMILALKQSQSTLTFTGTATGGFPSTYTASGKYSASTGQCLQNGGSGTWSGYLEAANASSQ